MLHILIMRAQLFGSILLPRHWQVRIGLVCSQAGRSGKGDNGQHSPAVEPVSKKLCNGHRDTKARAAAKQPVSHPKKEADA